MIGEYGVPQHHLWEKELPHVSGIPLCMGILHNNLSLHHLSTFQVWYHIVDKILAKRNGRDKPLHMGYLSSWEDHPS